MDIPNLSQTQNQPIKPSKGSPVALVIIVVLAITAGFWISRFLPSKTAVSMSDIESNSSETVAQASVAKDLKIGVLYGNINQTFKDTATGTIKSGGVNGEGTHTLEREGGVTQNAALTSSVVDLDLFVGKKVEVKGETNKSNKAGWLMDVGNIKILE